MLKDFKKFILRGNVVDLAVAVVVGTAFTAVVTSLVENFITPLLAAIGGQPDFSALSFSLNKSDFNYGRILNALISFLSVAAVVFFFVVTPLNKLVTKVKSGKEAEKEPTERQCPECLSNIPRAAKRCKYCTAVSKPSKS